jgi:hypothetical protein
LKKEERLSLQQTVVTTGVVTIRKHRQCLEVIYGVVIVLLEV